MTPETTQSPVTRRMDRMGDGNPQRRGVCICIERVWPHTAAQAEKEARLSSRQGPGGRTKARKEGRPACGGGLSGSWRSCAPSGHVGRCSGPGMDDLQPWRPQSMRPRVHSPCDHASTIHAATRPQYMRPRVHSPCDHASTVHATTRSPCTRQPYRRSGLREPRRRRESLTTRPHRGKASPRRSVIAPAVDGRRAKPRLAGASLRSRVQPARIESASG